MFNGSIYRGGQQLVLLTATIITTALTGTTPGTTYTKLGGLNYLVVESIFTYGSGGTTAKVWIQTSFDGGTTWCDIASHAFTTATASKMSALTTAIAPATQAQAPTDATLADNTVNNGLLGDRVRMKITTTGTYGGSTTLKIVGYARG